MDKINNGLLVIVPSVLLMLFYNSATGRWLKNNKRKSEAGRLDVLHQLEADSEYNYFRSWCRTQQAAFKK